MNRKEYGCFCASDTYFFRDDFQDWLRANWEIYQEFERHADAVVAAGRTHYSARTIAEVIRHETALRDGTSYKLNGNMVPDMARLYMQLNPNCGELFELRARKVEAAQYA